MLTMTFTSQSPTRIAPTGGLWVPCARVKVTHRVLDATGIV